MVKLERCPLTVLLSVMFVANADSLTNSSGLLKLNGRYNCLLISSTTEIIIKSSRNSVLSHCIVSMLSLSF